MRRGLCPKCSAELSGIDVESVTLSTRSATVPGLNDL